MLADLTITRDDELCGRWRTCLFCGHRAAQEGVIAVGRMAWCIVLCDRCAHTPGWQAVDALLRQRARSAAKTP